MNRQVAGLAIGGDRTIQTKIVTDALQIGEGELKPMPAHQSVTCSRRGTLNLA